MTISGGSYSLYGLKRIYEFLNVIFQQLRHIIYNILLSLLIICTITGQKNPIHTVSLPHKHNGLDYLYMLLRPHLLFYLYFFPALFPQIFSFNQLMYAVII